LEFKAVLEADESAATKKDVHAALAQLKKLQDAQDAKDKGRLVAMPCNTLRHDVATPYNTLRHDATQQHAPKAAGFGFVAKQLSRASDSGWPREGYLRTETDLGGH
jgi:hypothetical protein